MKRILKGLILAFVGVFGLTLASCGEKTQTPVTPTPGTPEHQHALGEGWKRDSAVHWQECSGCDELVNMAAHDYGDWVKDDKLCQQTRDCKVCGYRETQSVDHTWNAEGTCTHCGEALVITQYYVRGSFGGSDWPALDEYKLPIDYNTRTAEITVSLTAGDEFKVADANWSAEFNINTIVCEEGLFDGTNNIIVKTTADYKIVLSKLETSTPVCTITQLCVHDYTWTKVEGKTCDYTGVCSKCGVTSSKVEHAGYGEWTLVEGKTCDYEQVCACGDKKTKVEHTWGDDIVCDKCQAVNVVQYYVRGDMNSWGSDEASGLVLSADKKSSSLLLVVEAGQGFKIASADWAHEFNFDTITFNVAGFEKAADSNNIVASKAGVYMVNVSGLDTLEPTCTIDPVQLYVKGGMNGWAANADYALVYDKETDTATFTLEYADLSIEFKIAPDNWDLYNKHYNIGTLADGKYGYGTAEADAGNIKFTELGFYVIKVANVTTGEPVVTIEKGTGEVKPVVTPVPELYVRGSFDAEWDALDAYKLVVDAEAKQATLKVYLEKGTKFKVASADWGFEYKGSTVKSVPGLLAGDNDIEVLVSGYYLFTVAGTDDKATATCTIELVAQDLTSSFKMSDDQYGVAYTEAGAIVDTLTKYRFYVAVDAEGRIAYMVDMPIAGYGNPYETSYARHSAYSDYKTNPAFTQLSDPKEISGTGWTATIVDYKVQVPTGGFVLELYAGSEANGDVNSKVWSFIKSLTGKDYAEYNANSSAINVDNIRLALANGKVSITVLGGTEVKDLTVEGVKALTSDDTVLVTGKVTKNESGYNAITDGTNVISFYNNYDHLHEGDEITVVAQFSGENKNLQNFQLVAVTKKAVADTELELTKVTSVDQLVDGARVIIAYDKFAMGAQSGSKTRSAYPFADPCVQVIKLVKSDNSWVLQVGEKEYLCLNSNNNEIHTGDSITDNAKWNIAITEGVLTITSVAFPEREIQYNKSSAFFRTYKGTQEDIELYVLADEEVSQSIVLNEITEAVETFTDKATLNSITGYTSNFTFTDDVIVRINGDGNKISRLELNKNGAGVISFNATGKVTLTLTVKSTGGSNISAFAVSVNGQNIVANETAVAMECTKKDTTETEKAAGTLYAYTESETVIDSNGNDKAGATDENMYAVYGSDNLTVTFTIDASYVAGGAVVEIYSPASIQGRGVGVTGVTVETAE